MPKLSEKNPTYFGKKLIQLLERRNISDSQFAEEMGISQPNVYVLKYKTEKPRPKTLKRLANYFKVDISYFYPTPEFEVVKSPFKEEKIKVWVMVEINGKVVKKTQIL